MSAADQANTSTGRPTNGPEKGDRYLFGSMDSMAKNQNKLNEVNWGYDQPEGIVLAWISGVLAAGLLVLGASGTLSSWTAAILQNNTNSVATSNAVVLQEKIQAERGTIRKTLNLA